MTVLPEHTAEKLREAIEPLPGMLDRIVELLRTMRSGGALHPVADEMRSLTEDIAHRVADAKGCLEAAEEDGNR
jgi:hypothetical protein